tara:strand:+ start:25091 stop:25963 length:873 start_codon:yes stop_codon:yes gene_type:complete
MNNKKILIFGGSGFLGKSLALASIEKGFNVSVFDLKNPEIDDVNFLKGNISNPSDFENIGKYDYVINLAAIADIDEADLNFKKTIEVNLIGQINILDFVSRSNPKRFLFSSSMYVFGNLGGVYGATKRASEIITQEYSKKYGFDFTFLRYGSLYGPGSQSWNSIQKYIDDIYKNKKIIHWGTGEEVREYIHIYDAANLTIDSMLDESCKNKALTITGTQKVTSKEVLEMIFEMMELKPVIKFEKKNDINHYKHSPYNHNFPLTGTKLMPKSHIDFGQGIFELMREMGIKD